MSRGDTLASRSWQAFQSAYFILVEMGGVKLATSNSYLTMPETKIYLTMPETKI